MPKTKRSKGIDGDKEKKKSSKEEKSKQPRVVEEGTHEVDIFVTIRGMQVDPPLAEELEDDTAVMERLNNPYFQFNLYGQKLMRTEAFPDDMVLLEQEFRRVHVDKAFLLNLIDTPAEFTLHANPNKWSPPAEKKPKASAKPSGQRAGSAQKNRGSSATKRANKSKSSDKGKGVPQLGLNKIKSSGKLTQNSPRARTVNPHSGKVAKETKGGKSKTSASDLDVLAKFEINWAPFLAGDLETTVTYPRTEGYEEQGATGFKELEITIRVSEAVCSEKQLDELNPLVVTLESAYGLPNIPQSFAQLDELCEPVRLEMEFFDTPTIITPSFAHAERIVWHHRVVFFSSLLDQTALGYFLEHGKAVVRVHDRDRRGRVALLPSSDAATAPEAVTTASHNKKDKGKGDTKEKAPAKDRVSGREKSAKEKHSMKDTKSQDKRQKRQSEKRPPSRSRDVERKASDAEGKADKKADKSEDTSEPAGPPSVVLRGTRDPHGVAKMEIKDLLHVREVKVVADVLPSLPEDDLLNNYEETLDDKRLPGLYVECGTTIKATFQLARNLKVPKMEKKFCRSVFIFRYGDTAVLTKVQQRISALNAAALGMTGGGLAAQVATAKLTDEQLADPDLDLVSGVQVIDIDFRMIICEGLAAGAMKDIHSLFPKMRNSEELAVLSNETVTFKDTLYRTRAVDFKRIKLTVPLRELMKNKEVFIRNHVPKTCTDCLRKLHEVRSLPRLRNLARMDVFPTMQELASIEKKYGAGLTNEDFLGVTLNENNDTAQPVDFVSPSSGGDSWDDFFGGEADVSESGDEEGEQARHKRIDDDNVAYKALLKERAATQTQDFLEKNREKYRGNGSKVERTGDFSYSTQYVRQDPQVEALKNKALEHVGQFYYTYNPEYASQTIEPVSEAEVRAQEEAAKRAKFITPGGWSHPNRADAREHNRPDPALRLHPARVAELAEPWEGVPRQSLRSITPTLCNADGETVDRPPFRIAALRHNYIQDVAASVDRNEKTVEERMAILREKEKAEWQEKVIVKDTRVRFKEPSIKKDSPDYVQKRVQSKVAAAHAAHPVSVFAATPYEDRTRGNAALARRQDTAGMVPFKRYFVPKRNVHTRSKKRTARTSRQEETNLRRMFASPEPQHFEAPARSIPRPQSSGRLRMPPKEKNATALPSISPVKGLSNKSKALSKKSTASATPDGAAPATPNPHTGYTSFTPNSCRPGSPGFITPSRSGASPVPPLNFSTLS